MLTADLIGAASLLKIDFFLYWLENSSVDPNVLLKISPMETAKAVINSFFFYTLLTSLYYLPIC